MMTVLLHGFTGGARSWDRVIRGPRYLAENLAGHGLDTDSHDWESERARLFARLPVGPVHLVGYSMGARVALGLLARDPARFARATLIAPHPGLPPAERPARRAADARWIELVQQDLAAFVSAWEQQPLFATQQRLPAELQDARRAARLAHDPAGLARALRTIGLAEMPDLRPVLSTLTMPIQILVGALDHKFRALGLEIARALPHATLQIVPDRGHDLLLEAPRAVRAALTSEVCS